MTKITDYDHFPQLGKKVKKLQELLTISEEEHYKVIKMCKKLKEQLDEANDVIKGYADAYKKYPDGTMMTFVVNKHPAHHYLDKWGIK